METYNLTVLHVIIVAEERVQPVASSEGVKICCPEDGRVSFFNSPYPAHALFGGIDVYPKGIFGDAAPSPVGGEVKRIRRIKCPKGKSFESSDCDYVILLCSLENPERLIKVLHVDPCVKVGDVVEPGSELGTLLRSGFFNSWTDPHIHVEVRNPTDPIRARGGFKFERLMEVDGFAVTRDLKGVVVESKPEYVLVELNQKCERGVSVNLDGQVGLLDAGIPHYDWMGIHVKNALSKDGVVKLCGRKIGIVRSVHSNMCVAECCNPVFEFDGKRVGLSLYLYPFSVFRVKIIPRRPGGLALERFEEVSLVIS